MCLQHVPLVPVDVERLEAVLAQLQAGIPAREARLAELTAIVLAPASEVSKYARGVALEEIADRNYVFGGYASFAAFLKAHGISRTTAHRLRVLARASDPANVEALGPHRAYLSARARVEMGQAVDALTTRRRVRAWLRRQGVRFARVEIATDELGHPCVRIEVRVRTLAPVVGLPKIRR